MNIDSHGDLFVGDYDSNRIQKFDSDGNFLYTFGWGVKDGANEFQVCTSACRQGIEGSGNGQLGLSPDGIAIDSQDNVFVADLHNHRVQKFSSPTAFWGLDPQGTSVLSYLSVSSSHSSSPVTCINCTDGGNNINWTFAGSPPPPPAPPAPSGGGGRSSGGLLLHFPFLQIPTITLPGTKPVLPNTAIKTPNSVCKFGDAFNPATGLICTSYTAIDTVCPVGSFFSSVTGLACTSNQTAPNQFTPPKSTLSCPITGTLRIGSKGNDVKCLQTILGGLIADGSFGPKTKAAVIIFQKNHGLTPDGIFGPKSLGAL
jgi:hypothetical protein